MNNLKPHQYLVSIGIAYSVDKTDPNIFPEEALCLASEILYKDSKACSLVYTLLKNNFDLFDDQILNEQILVMKDKLAIAMLGGLLYKSNKDYFEVSIKSCKQKSKEADLTKIKKSLHILADHGQMRYDFVFLKEFKIKINEVLEVDEKKTFPRKSLILRNNHFALRLR